MKIKDWNYLAKVIFRNTPIHETDKVLLTKLIHEYECETWECQRVLDKLEKDFRPHLENEIRVMVQESKGGTRRSL